ncbi:MAG: LpqB family beta-propeller domain-containing protein, partial [Candidatus Poribacteria bacterium]|nr:LpqB family beta-propeller domain-containing protein [Candidatus Poribacteria bacterium]
SPDGKKIAFVSNRNNVNKDHKRIWVIEADGKNPVRLTDGVSDSFPDWSPDGKTILYVAGHVPKGHNLAPGGIVAMDADGNNKKLLKNKGGIHPSWSPDGNRIAFISGNIGRDTQVHVMDADGRNPRQLTRDTEHKHMPSWSPDGRHIAYESEDRIWVMNSDGKNQRRLTNIVGDEHPTWSPQSDAIAFHAERRGGGRGIYLADLTNGAVNVMQHAPKFWDQQPDWFYPGELAVSPEGSRITMWGRLKKIASSLR